MRRGTVLALALVLGFVAFSVAAARMDRETSAPSQSVSRWPNTVFWSDNMEGSVSGWTTVDNTAGVTPRFHVDTYMAYNGHSWWCGTFDYDAVGGYGNSWDQRLNIPATDWSGATYPLLEMFVRYDSEPDYDFTYVQAESNGVFLDLNRGFNGVGNWQTWAAYIGPYDNPAVCRIRFLSDGAYSNEDGNYVSTGGAFACDDIRIYDYPTGTTYFLDDVESGGLCVPGVPASSGNYWHVVVDVCSSYSPTHSWWCGDDADTSLIPPNLNNALITPVVDISGALTCTLRMAIHAEVPTVDNDGWLDAVRFDGGTWYSLGAWWGDFGACSGWGANGLNGEPLDAFLPASQVQYKITFTTTDNGCGPGVAGGAGVNVDNTRFEGVDEDAVVPRSWGAIKFLYR
jgi:hypothetical protein